MEGDLQICSMPSDHNGGVIRNGNCGYSGLSEIEVPSNSNLDPDSVATEVLEAAEEASRDIGCRIHPTVVDDQKRKQVIEYVQGLIWRSLGSQVFPYGSVPLKTYLPDGDIDLTVISSPNSEDALVHDVCAVLRKEESNQDALYEVKDVQYIDAEVKLVKCIVQNIVVDISFNQLGGLSTLCFLERADQIVGKNHLFKRSIILIKAWCYYESRILGAHHGLISTYALETLILYIFHLFHHSLNRPLAVLYRFLDYFSKFDWDNYVISLNGPVCKSSLQAEPLGSSGELLFSDVFLSKCARMFTVPSRKLETFPQKHLNIIDPLKETNNLGRSVNRGNFYRIRSAFKYGARKLGQILVLPKSKIADELNNFFANTLVRHGSNHLNEAQNSTLENNARISANTSSSSVSSPDLCPEESIQRSQCGCDSPGASHCGRSLSHFQFSKSPEESEMVENGISPKEMVANFTSNDELKCKLQINPKENSSISSNSVCSCSVDKFTTPVVPATPSFADNVVPDNPLPMVVGDGETANVSENSNSFNLFLDLAGDYDIHLQSLEYVKYYHIYAVPAAALPCSSMLPQLQINSPSRSVSQSLHLQQHGYSQINGNGVFSPPCYYINHSMPYFGSEENRTRRGTGTYIPNMSYHSSNEERERVFSPRREKNLSLGIHGRWNRHAQDNGSNGHPQRHPQDNGSNGHLHRHPQDDGSNGHLQRHPQDNGSNGHLHRHPQDNGSNGQPQRHAQDNGTNGQLQRRSHHDGSNALFHRSAQDDESYSQLRRHVEDNSLPRTPRLASSTSEHSHELSEVEYPYLGNGRPISQPPHSSYPLTWGTPNVKGSSCPTEKIHSESEGLKQQERPCSERTSSSATSRSSGTSSPVLMAQSSERAVEGEQERIEVQSYNLRDEDFPPLSH